MKDIADLEKVLKSVLGNRLTLTKDCIFDTKVCLC
jgi:hypothetical protein